MSKAANNKGRREGKVVGFLAGRDHFHLGASGRLPWRRRGAFAQALEGSLEKVNWGSKEGIPACSEKGRMSERKVTY